MFSFYGNHLQHLELSCINLELEPCLLSHLFHICLANLCIFTLFSHCSPGLGGTIYGYLYCSPTVLLAWVKQFVIFTSYIVLPLFSQLGWHNLCTFTLFSHCSPSFGGGTIYAYLRCSPIVPPAWVGQFICMHVVHPLGFLAWVAQYNMQVFDVLPLFSKLWGGTIYACLFCSPKKSGT